MICLAVMRAAEKSGRVSCQRVFHVQNAKTPAYGAARDARASRKSTGAPPAATKATSSIP
jgi:hypothetical protein